jgi:hypothetical protein
VKTTSLAILMADENQKLKTPSLVTRSHDPTTPLDNKSTPHHVEHALPSLGINDPVGQTTWLGCVQNTSRGYTP